MKFDLIQTIFTKDVQTYPIIFNFVLLKFICCFSLISLNINTPIKTMFIISSNASSLTIILSFLHHTLTHLKNLSFFFYYYHVILMKFPPSFIDDQSSLKNLCGTQNIFFLLSKNIYIYSSLSTGLFPYARVKNQIYDHLLKSPKLFTPCTVAQMLVHITILTLPLK